MLRKDKFKVSVCISLLLLSSIFLGAYSNLIFSSENKTQNSLLHAEICDCNCFQAFLLDGTTELNKLINCYKAQIEQLAHNNKN